MRVVVFVGYKKSGKMIIVEVVVRVFKERGYRVVIVKSMYVEFDREGIDIWWFF